MFIGKGFISNLIYFVYKIRKICKIFADLNKVRLKYVIA